MEMGIFWEFWEFFVFGRMGVLILHGGRERSVYVKRGIGDLPYNSLGERPWL